MTASLIVQRNLTFYNVKDFRAAGDGITDDTTPFQAALNAAHAAGGGTVTSAPGASHLISAPLIINSNTKLLLDSSNIITLAANSNCNMIKNAAVTPQRTVTDAAITSATTTLTSATANFTSGDVGRTVGVAGAWQSGNVLIANITVVTNSTTVTLSVAATATVSGASCSIYTRDINIEIAGGYWQRGSNGYLGGVTSSPNYQTTQFRHVDGIYIHDLTVACAQKAYQVSLGDVTDYTVKNIVTVCSNSITNTDAVNIHGPAFRGLIDNIHGVNGDDFVSVHAYDGDGNLRDTIGNVTDMVVSNLFPNGCGQWAFKTHGGQGTLIRSITINGIHGSTLAGGVHLADTGIGPPSDNNIGDITIEDVDCITATSLINIYANNSVGDIFIKDIVWRSPLTSVAAITTSSGNSLRNITVDGVRYEASSSGMVFDVLGNVSNITISNVIAPDTSVQINGIVQIESGVNVNTVTLNNVAVYYTTNAQNTLVSNKGNLKYAHISNAYLNNGGVVYVQKNSGSQNSQVLLNNITLDSAYQLAQVQTGSTCDFAVFNLNVRTTNQSALIALTGTSANMTLVGAGLINPNSKTAFSRDGTQSPRINFREMLADLSQLTPTDQDMVNNNNGALSSGAGLCIFHTGGTGNGWKNIYSGSTY